MKKLWILTSLAFFAQFLNCCASSSQNDSIAVDVKPDNAGKVIVGYIPAWKAMRNVIDNTDLSILTHINIAFLNPDASGSFLSNGEPVCSDASASDITYVVTKAHQNGVKVLASLAGGIVPTCSGDWSTLLEPANRTNVVINLKALAEHFNLDGIDVDIEGALLTSIDAADNYTPFIQELRNVLHPLDKLVTCATASYVGGMIPKSSIPFFDYINIMAYDNHWNSSENHSTYQEAVRDMQMWLDLGCPANKLVMGVPFYGYGDTVGTGGASYQEIVAQNPNAAQVDEFGDYKYNGIPTIESKTEYAILNGAGIMIWEISQDTSGSLSLLQAIGRKL